MTFYFRKTDTVNINYLSFQERQQFHLEQLRAAEFRARAAAQQQLNAQQPRRGPSVLLNLGHGDQSPLSLLNASNQRLRRPVHDLQLQYVPP